MTQLKMCLFLVAAGYAAGQSQQPRPMVLSEFLDYWSSDAFDTAEILKLMEENGTDIDLSEANVSSMIDSARKVKRSPAEVGKVFVKLLKDCRNCRSNYWAPLGGDELINTLKKLGSAVAFQTLQDRGSNGLPVSTDFVKILRNGGAAPELIAVVEDRITLPIPDGFKVMRLDRSPEFSNLATEGKLTMHVSIDSEVVFLFRHNALFFKTLSGEDPVNFGCTFTAFGPATDDQKLTFSIDPVPPKDLKAKKRKAPVITSSSVPDPSGRTGIQWTINDIEKGPHQYDLEVKWKR